VTGDLLATVVAGVIRTRSGRFGVVIENVPQFDINVFLIRLAERTPADSPVRISILGASSPLVPPVNLPSRLALNDGICSPTHDGSEARLGGSAGRPYRQGEQIPSEIAINRRTS